MANLKAIYMTEVVYYDGTDWTELLVEKDGTKLSAYSGHIILYSTENPSPAPSSMPVTVDFNDLRMREATKPAEDKYTAFHAQGISTTQKSPIIRYKIAVGTWTTEEIITVNQNLHYMMINASLPTDAYSGAGSTATVNQSNATVQLKLYFPAFLATHINQDAVNDLKNLLQTAANWSVTKEGPTGSQTVTPSSVTVGTPTASSATNYGIAKVLVTLNCGLTFPMSGTYSLTATFQSNDVDSAYLLPGAHTVTATITVNSGSTTPPHSFFRCGCRDVHQHCRVMIHSSKTVIASLRNKHNVRVFIPEKLRIGGVSYVQPYKFIRVLPSAQPILISTRSLVALPISILINEVVVTAPFSIELIKSYLDQLSTYMQKYPAQTYRILPESKRSDAWNPQLMAGKASFTAS